VSRANSAREHAPENAPRKDAVNLPMMTGTLPDFPDEIGKIVRDVREKIKSGKHFGRAKDQEEDGALEICRSPGLNPVHERGMPGEKFSRPAFAFRREVGFTRPKA